jgi:hypothetical protein
MIATKRRQVYIGDDENKDGEMAMRDGIAFKHHDGKPDTWRRILEDIVYAIESGEGFDESA